VELAFLTHNRMAVPIDPNLRKTWKRVLYEKQGYPDDHVDDTFLESLVTNGKIILLVTCGLSSFTSVQQMPCTTATGP